MLHNCLSIGSNIIVYGDVGDTDNYLLLEYSIDVESGFTHLLEGCIVTLAV